MSYHVLITIKCYNVHHHVYLLSCPSSCLYLIMSIIMFISYHVHCHVYVLSCPSTCLCIIRSIILFIQYCVLPSVYVLSCQYSCTCFVVTIWPSSCSHFDVHQYVTHALKYIMYP
jgi:hypothetical protein